MLYDIVHALSQGLVLFVPWLVWWLIGGAGWEQAGRIDCRCGGVVQSTGWLHLECWEMGVRGGCVHGEPLECIHDVSCGCFMQLL